MATRPSSYLGWVPSGSSSYITTPTTGQQTTGWTAAERPPFQYLNWLFYTTDQWIQWFDTLTFSTVGAYDTAIPSANALVIAGGTIYAQSASTSNPGMMNTIAQTFAGNKAFNGLTSAGGAINPIAIQTIGASNPLSGTIQIGSFIDAIWASSATSKAVSFLSSATTAPTAFTLPLRAQFYSTNTAKGVGSIINYDISFFGEQPTQGSIGNAVLADNTPTGNWFINQLGTTPSTFGGTVTVNGDLVPSGISASSANKIFTTRTLPTASTATIGQFAISASGSGPYSTTSTSFVNVTNLNVSLVTSGRPVWVGLIPTPGSGASAFLQAASTGGTDAIAILEFSNNGNGDGSHDFGLQGAVSSPSFPVLNIPVNSVSYIDFPAAGTQNYQVSVRCVSAAYAEVNNCSLFAYEI